MVVSKIVSSSQLVVSRPHVDFEEAVNVRQVDVDTKRTPKPGTVLLRNVWAGVNYADVVVARAFGGVIILLTNLKYHHFHEFQGKQKRGATHSPAKRGSVKSKACVHQSLNFYIPAGYGFGGDLAPMPPMPREHEVRKIFLNTLPAHS